MEAVVKSEPVQNVLFQKYTAIVDSFRGFSAIAFELYSSVKQESRFWLLADVSHLISHVFWGADFDLGINFTIGVNGVKIQWGQRSNF